MPDPVKKAKKLITTTSPAQTERTKASAERDKKHKGICRDSTFNQTCEVQICQLGCKEAEESYGFHIAESLNDPRPPVASAIDSTSILLKWEEANSSEIRYIIQWRYSKLPGQWVFTEVVEDTKYNVTKLHPYTEYAFRVIWIITGNLYKHSPESRSYRTKPYGVPSSVPLIIRTESPSPTSVVVEWKPPVFLNGPLVGYHIELQSGTEHILRDANQGQLHYSIYPTKPGTTYRFLFISFLDSLYRMALPGIVLEADSKSMEPIVANTSLLTFSLNPYFKELIYISGRGGTVHHIFLDGTPMDTNSLLPFDTANIQHVVHSCSLWVLTHGKQVYVAEEHDKQLYPTEVSVESCSEKDGNFDHLFLWDFSTQPLPVPLHEPTHLQVVLGFNSAALTWRKPVPGAGLGPNAWQQWSYDVITVNGNVSIYKEAIYSTNITIYGLSSSTVYTFRIRASSPGGKGPWSSIFQGTTLKEGANPYVLAGNELGTWKVFLDKFTNENMLPSVKNAIDLDWMNSSLYWTNSTGFVHVTSLFDSGRETKVIQSLQNVGALAVDWISNTLYWADSEKNNIFRMHLDLEVHTKVRDVAGKVQDLQLDPLQGYVYWTTAQCVEYARINGDQPGLFEELPNFSGKQISGLTLDFDHGALYWLIQDNTRLEINQAELIREGNRGKVKRILSSDSLKTSQHMLQYYFGRLLWINEKGDLQIVEMGKNQTVHLSGDVPFTAFTVVHRKPLPDGFSTLPLVIPTPVPASSFKIQGNSSRICIIWESAMNVNYGTLYYRFESQVLMKLEDLSTHHYCITGLEPFKEFDVTVKPYTYWGVATETQVTLCSPEAAPSAPENPRMFVNLRKDILLDTVNMDVEFRWNEPAQTNGVLRGYTVYYMMENCSDTLQADTAMNVTANVTTFKLTDADPAKTYCIQLIESILCSAPKGMTVDWIGQKLYVLLDKQEDANSSIYVLDLELQGTKLEKLLTSSQNIYSIGIYPKKSLLFWTQSMSGDIGLVSYSLTERLPRTLISPHLEINRSVPEATDCNCTTTKLQLDGNLAVDTTDSEPERLFFSTHDHEIWASDLNGCLCWKKINSTGATGFGAISLTLNSHAIYWITRDGAQSAVYMGDKSTGNVISEYQDSSLVAVMAFSELSQPYPDPQCLIPKAYKSAPEVVNKSDTSLVIYIPPVEFPSACSEISRPTPTYILHYAEFQDNRDHVNCTHGIQCDKTEVQTNTMELKGLKSYTRYLIQVSVRNHYRDMSKELGPPAINWTWFGVPSAPRQVEVLVLSDRRAKVSWAAPLEPKGPLEQLRYQVRYNGNNYWPAVPARLEEQADGQRQIELANLKSGTEYQFQVLSFSPVGGSFSQSETVLGKTFLIPQSPHVLSVGNTTATILWQFTASRTVEKYWFEVSQGPCSNIICTWRNEHLTGFYRIRVVAVNGIGMGEFSDTSGEIIMKIYEPHENLVLLVLGPVCATVIMAVFCISIAAYAQNANHNKQMGDVTTLHVNYNPDLELAWIRDLNASVIQTNIWYTSSCLPTHMELESLPLFPREKLTLLNFLGSGAFGEVFEGKAEDILGPGSGDVKVAVKALRKGATDHEKSEFLKEAYLMSHFDHAHIVKLLGVCLLNEPQFLILELMKGRDLLSYLRGARGSRLHQPLLYVGDLIEICLDVAKGCTYLEKMHFVHRDLAARNCLVSTKEYNSTNRKVKIGDFGLARDIYKNDYYRKEGEGLLPVRWMAPESLIDGLFTNQSDVWSFGILMWEVMTLGQQPYPARTNLEVLHFVRTGGRLEKPNSCPDNV
ncbi:proto-oncogene tyrosine-protein kinase ROS-like [Mustelus asterias]